MVIQLHLYHSPMHQNPFSCAEILTFFNVKTLCHVFPRHIKSFFFYNLLIYLKGSKMCDIMIQAVFCVTAIIYTYNDMV